MKRGIHTSEFWIVLLALLLSAFFAVRNIPASHAVPAAAIASSYAFCRTMLKHVAIRCERAAKFGFTNIFEDIMAAFDWTNIVASVDTVVENFIASRFPKSAPLNPELDAAVAANIALAKKVMDQYALAKLETVGGAVLDAIATKYPAAAPEIAALKTKLAAIGAGA